MTYHRPTREAAAGRWRGILIHLGVPGESLRGKHAACPMCGGTDRFRFDNKGGLGTWICNNCGAGDGMMLAEKFTGQDFRDVAQRVDGILGNEKIGADPKPREVTDEQRRAALREVYAASQQAQPGDLVDAYLRSRDLDELAYPKALRFAPSIRDGEGGVRPAMVSVVSDPAGKPCTLHRTFLRPDGAGKAEMEAPRKIMPGCIPDGASVRLSDYAGGPLGIAEGVETALAASALYEIPVWAALSTSMMAKWEPPEGCDEVTIFGDNDAKFGGHAAAYRLAHRLACNGLEVFVKFPERPGQDWADVHSARAKP